MPQVKLCSTRTWYDFWVLHCHNLFPLFMLLMFYVYGTYSAYWWSCNYINIDISYKLRVILKCNKTPIFSVFILFQCRLVVAWYYHRNLCAHQQVLSHREPVLFDLVLKGVGFWFIIFIFIVLIFKCYTKGSTITPDYTTGHSGRTDVEYALGYEIYCFYWVLYMVVKKWGRPDLFWVDGLVS